MFTQGGGLTTECQYCAETRQLVEEVAQLSDKLSVEIRDLTSDASLAASYGIDKIPAIAILRDEGTGQGKDYGIRYYGIPSGYEFGSLIEDIVQVSTGDSGLTPQSRMEVARLTRPVHIQVFVTPTCPYCPRAVLLAHKLAMESEYIRSDMVEAIEFPHLAARYQVYGVPRIVINDVIHIEGAVPEHHLVGELMKVMDDAEMTRLRAEWKGQEDTEYEHHE